MMNTINWKELEGRECTILELDNLLRLAGLDGSIYDRLSDVKQLNDPDDDINLAENIISYAYYIATFKYNPCFS